MSTSLQQRPTAFDSSGTGNVTLLFVHGFGCGREDWNDQRRYFDEAFRTVACDLPGHGQSIDISGPEVFSMARSINAVRKACSAHNVVLVGHSMACRVVLESCHLDPIGVAGVILVDGSLVGSPPAQAAVETAKQRMMAAGSMEAFLSKSFDDMLLGERSSKREGQLRDRFCSVPLSFAREALLGIVAWDAELSAIRLAETSVPLCLIQSTDRGPSFNRVRLSSASESQWLQFALNHARNPQVALVTEAGHFPQIDQPDAVNAAISRFLADLVGRGAPAAGRHSASAGVKRVL